MNEAKFNRYQARQLSLLKDSNRRRNLGRKTKRHSEAEMKRVAGWGDDDYFLTEADFCERYGFLCSEKRGCHLAMEPIFTDTEASCEPHQRLNTLLLTCRNQ